MSAQTPTDLDKDLSVEFYQDLINSDKLLIRLHELKNLHDQQSDSVQPFIPMLEKASFSWQAQGKWLKVEIIEEFLLHIAVQEGDTLEIERRVLAFLHSLEQQHQVESRKKIVEFIKEYLTKDNRISFKIILLYKLINRLLDLYGVSQESLGYHSSYQKIITECSVLIDQDSIETDFSKAINFGLPAFYFSDTPRENNAIRQIIAKLGLRAVQSIFTPETDIYRNTFNQRLSNRIYKESSTKLRIGYITNYFCKHSVGWLVRWTLKHHDLNRFDIYTYSTTKRKDSVYNSLFQQYGDRMRCIGGKQKQIMDKIQDDEIDILVDLGSLTEHTNCLVMAVKPAPVQITWLGLDASQIPTIDYYIGDSYSFPDEAQSYYSERLIKMPNCFIAVDGFETGRSSLSRQSLGIPDDAIVYFSGQTGPKRHPDNVKLQVQILSQVPNSYFLVKFRRMDEEIALKNFIQLADKLGVESDRIKVISLAATSEIHRANLKIADIILDTYPYNGATTTLEALWCEVPLVTRVGQQFAARNSYSMLMNAGVTEGIAWTDEEYVAWGVRLGLNRDLRDRVRWKLRQSKRTSPLWDARQFTRDLEAVYQQIWERYLRVNGHEKFIIR